jgi:BirA family biotin operon repressor/biotin-[acetyl-CoA-carboxylase] ligase
MVRLDQLTSAGRQDGAAAGESAALLNVLPLKTLPVLRLLAHDEFFSGEVIAQRLNCSRGTVHNAIRAAQEAGFRVHAVHGRGYRLAAPVSWLDADRLHHEFDRRGIHLQHFDQIASTNAQMLDWAARAAPERAPQRALICAEWQNQGRGRRGRDWHTDLGGGLMFSFLWRSARPSAQLSGLSLAVGVALVEALREFGLAGARVKWPNDIQVAGAKLAGVLIELASDKLASDVLAPSTAVIGIGLNVAGGEALSQRVGQPVTDLSAHLGRVDRNELLLHLVTSLDAALTLFEREGFAPFHAAWHASHAHQAQPVCLQLGHGELITGVALGVDAQGALQIETASGIQTFHSGEVCLRAIAP